MYTEIVEIHSDPSGQGVVETEAIQRAGEILKAGGLVAFPTETVYGLGGDAMQREAAKKIYAAKGRPSDNPLIVHIARLSDLEAVSSFVPETAWLLAEKYWPGPLTMILPKGEKIPLETTGGLSTVAVRMPRHSVALALIEAGGGFVAAPSANTSGKPSPTLANHVAEDLSGRIEMILDGGPVGIGVESTILDLTEEVPTILRPGYVTEEMLRRELPEVRMDPGLSSKDESYRPKAPGMKYRHYAPKANLVLVSGDREAVAEKIRALVREGMEKGKKIGILAAEESKGSYPEGIVLLLGKRDSGEDIAQHLYEQLRRFDELGVDEIYSECFSEEGIGRAIMNRLRKAAGQQIIRV